MPDNIWLSYKMTYFNIDPDLVQNYLANQDNYIRSFDIKENNKIRKIVTYKDNTLGWELDYFHYKIASEIYDSNKDKFSKYSYAYKQGVSCKDAFTPHINSVIFYKLDISDFFNSIDGLDGIGENGIYNYSANIMNLGIPFSIPFSMRVEENSITEFLIDNVDLSGVYLSVKIVPYAKKLNIEKNEIESGRIDISGIVDYAFSDLDIDLIKNILENKQVSFDIKGTVLENIISAKANIDFSQNESIKALLTGNFDGIDFSVYFENGVVYLSIDNVAISLEIAKILNIVQENGVSLSSITIDDILLVIKNILDGFTYSNNKIGLSYELLHFFKGLFFGNYLHYGEESSLKDSIDTIFKLLVCCSRLI